MMHVFVTGMFRSGTTMLARMLASHQQTAFASDPFAPLFKAARNTLLATNQPDRPVDRQAPFGDYYLDSEGLRLLDAVRATSLVDLQIDRSEGDLPSRLAESSLPCSPDLAPKLATLRGENCLDLLEAGLDAIAQVYGGDVRRVVGFKDVWVTEFVPAFLRALPSGRAICIVRDPRAVYLSKLQQDDQYPLLFMARQWRKNAALAWLWNELPETRDRVLVVRYEDLVRKPGDEILRISRFLGLDGVGDMPDPESWNDGGGGPWSQNTSFGTGRRAFDTSAVDRWRDRLPQRERQLVEWTCRLEMGLFGYESTSTEWNSPWGAIMDPPLVDNGRLAVWIRPYVDERAAVVSRHLCSEFVRWEAVKSKANLTLELQRLFCLDPTIFHACRAQLAGMESTCLS